MLRYSQYYISVCSVIAGRYLPQASSDVYSESIVNVIHNWTVMYEPAILGFRKPTAINVPTI
jgi:hypothetical protein